MCQYVESYSLFIINICSLVDTLQVSCKYILRHVFRCTTLMNFLNINKGVVSTSCCYVKGSEINSYSRVIYVTKYSRMEQEQFFKGCLRQILLGLFLNVLSQMIRNTCQKMCFQYNITVSASCFFVFC